MAGSGTPEDSYVIQGYEIVPSRGPGIYIGNTTAHFIIRDCSIHDATSGDNLYFRTSGSESLSISDVRIGGMSMGVELSESSDAIIHGLNLRDAELDGIYLLGSKNVTVKGNSISMQGTTESRLDSALELRS